MAEELENTGAGENSGTEQNLQTLDALHLDGKGAPTLEDADERSLSDLGDTRPEDVTGNANVQSAGRSTFEQMVEGGIREQAVMPTADHLALDTVQPTFRDNNVDARFDNVQPRFNNVGDLTESQRRGPERDEPTTAPDPLLTRDPVDFPRGDGEEDGRDTPTATQSAISPPPAEEPAPGPTGGPTQPAERDEEIIIPKVADAPSVLVSAASGTEDTDTKLNIRVATADRDGGSETISTITIGNVPAGFSFVDGAGNPVGIQNGTGWTFTLPQLDNLYLRQPGNYSGDITLTVSATSVESNGSTASTTTSLNVHVEAVADAPDLIATASGTEDQLIPLNITVSSNDAVLEGVGANAPETISGITISNVPAGFSFVTAAGVPAGVANGNGTWSFTAAELAGLHLKQPGNYSGELTLTVSATSLESNGSTATTTTDMVVHVEAVADAPDLTATASGTEDQLIPLTITVGSNDAVLEGVGANAPETISGITISNVPAGFSFVTAAGVPAGVANGNGTWSFTAAELAGLHLKQPGNYSGELTLTVSATSLESNGSTATTTTDMVVRVEAVADAPALTVADSAGMENALIPLTISVGNNDAALEGPGANAPETQLIYISNLPAGATLYIGDAAHPVTAQVGGAGLTIDGTTIPAGAYVVSAADLPNLKVQSPPNDSHDFTLNVWATSTESSNGDVAVTGFQTIQVDVGVHAPSASGSGTGQEGGWADLTLSASVNFPDGTENLRVFIADLEPGAVLAYGDGTPVPVGADGRYEVTGRLDDLKVGWPDSNEDKDIDFNLVAEVRDGDTDADSAAVRAAAPDFASTTVPVTVTIQAVADGPSTLSASGIGVEDKWFDLDVTTGLIDTDGSETLTVTITGPAGFQLAAGNDTAHPYAGVLSADGHTVTYTLTPAQLQTLQMRAAADSDADVDLRITATTRETATGAGQIALESKSTSIDLNVKILSDADKPVVSVIKDTQTIEENGLFDLSKTLSGTFNDGTGTHAAVSGASTEAGSVRGASDSADGSETITYRITANQDSQISLDGGTTKQAFRAGDTIEVSAADIASGKVQLGGVADWASSSAHPTLTFSVVTVATEANDAADDALQGSLVREGVRVSDPAVLTIAVNPVADASTARLSVVASGYEDGLLNAANHTANATGSGINVVPTLTLADADLSEAPTGAVTITSSDAAMLAGSLTISGNGASIVRVDGVDAHGNPTATWTISGGNFTTTADNTFRLDGLVFHPAANSDADPRYDISVQFQDTDGGALATVSATDQTITVTAVADAPTLVTHAAGGTESASGPALIDLNIQSALTDTDGSETLSVYVTGIPAGDASLSSYREVFTGDVTIGGVTIHGTADNPVYRLSAGDLAGLKLQVNQGYSEDMQLSVYSASVESNGGDVAVTGPATLNVDIGVLAPTISGMGAVSGDEDSYISLANLVTNRQAGDDTDSISVYVEGLDSGATLYKLVDGVHVALAPTTYKDASGNTHIGYDVTSLRDGGTGALSGVYVKWDAAHKADDIHLTLRSVVADTDNDAAADAGGFDRNTPFGQPYNDISERVESLTVTVRAHADAPATLTASAIGVEDKGVALNIASTLADTDGSETLTITVSGVPAGVQLSAGTIVATDEHGLTTWSIGPAASNGAMQSLLSNLRMTNLPADSDADFDIVVRATATERETGAQLGTASAYTETTVNVKVLSDADKPVVSVIKDTQTIDEDGLFDLSKTLSGTFNDGIGTHAAVSGASTEAGSVRGASDSADSSETITYRITANQDSVISRDGGVTKQAFRAGDTVEVSAADIASGKVQLGGVADWASSSAHPTLTFSVVTVATEDNAAADDALEAGLPADLTREGVRVSDPAVLTIAVNPVADASTARLSVVASGYEDGLLNAANHTANATGSGINVVPTLTLADADLSEAPTGAVTITSSDAAMLAGSLTISGNGASIVRVDGVDAHGNPTATWTISGGNFTTTADNTFRLDGLVFHPAANSDADPRYDISVQFQDTDGGALATVSATDQTITVMAVADKPTLTVQNTAAWESASGDRLIPLNVSTASVDTDGSETQIVYLTNLPSAEGSVIGTHVVTHTSGTHGGLVASATNPVYEIPAADLGSLQLRINQGYSSDIQLKVVAASVEQEGDVALSDPATLRVDIGVLDPVISGNAVAGQADTFGVSGVEDTKISLSSVKVAVTAAGDNETRTVYVEAPAGVTLYGSNGNALTRVTFTDAAGVSHNGYNVTNNLTGSGNLNVTVKNDTAHSDANFDLKVYALVRDQDAGNATLNTAYANAYHDTAQSVATVQVTVKADADAATLNGSAVAVEDKWVNLNLSASLNDTDGSENLTVTIAGVPSGLTLTGTTPVSETVAADGSRTYTIGPCATNAEMQSALSGLKLTGLGQGNWANTDGSFALTVTATTTESATGSEVAAKTATVTKSVTVDILSNADTPVVQVESAPQTIAEDAFFSLHTRIGDHFAVEGKSGEAGSLLGASTSADGSETITFRIKPVEAGSRLAIDVGGDGQISAGDLSEAGKYWNAAGGYWEVPAALVNGNKVWVGGAANWSSTSDSDNLHFDIQTVATEARDGNANGPADMPRAGVAVSDPMRLTLNVTPVADSTNISLSGSGVEDQVGGIPFAPTIRLADTDGSEQVTGTVDIMVRCDANGDFPGDLSFARPGMVDVGTETYEGVTYHVFKVPASELSGSPASGYTLSGLTFVPDANSDLDIQYRVRVTTTEKANSHSYVTVSSMANLDVAAVADAPKLTVGKAAAGTDTVVGLEDSVIRLDLAAELQDTDGSEVLTNAELRNVPQGWGVITVDANGNRLSSLVGTDADGDGKYTFVLDPRTVTLGSGIFVALVPPHNSDVDATGITFWAKATEVTGAANPNDPDPSDNQVSVPTAERSVTFNVTLDPVADTPVLQVTSARGNEDTSIPLDIRTSVTDADETAMVEITGVPSGGVLTYVGADGQAHSVTFGNGVTALTVTPAEARTLRFTPPEDASGKVSLTVRSIVTDVDTENPGVSHSTDRTATLDVYVKGVNDEILDQHGNVVNATSGNLTASGTEDADGNLVNLNLGSYSVADSDGSETLSAVIQGLPSGFNLVVKTEDGIVDTAEVLQYIGKDANDQPIWSVSEAYLKYVHVQTPHDYAGSFNLSVRLITTEDDGAATAFDKTLTVNVDAVADAPTVTVTANVGEDGWGAAGIPIEITVKPADISPESPEHVSQITIDMPVPAGLPAGTRLQLQLGDTVVDVGAGTEFTIKEGDALWSHYNAATGTLSDLTLLGVPDGWSKDLPITVTATSTDINNTTAVTTSNATVVIRASADEPEWTLGSGTSTIDTPVDLGLDVTRFNDPDGSESVYFIVSGVPNGVTLNHGYNNGDGTWTVHYSSDANWTLTATSHYSGQATLTVTPVVVDKDPDGGTDTKVFDPKHFDLVVTDANGGVGGGWPTSPAGDAPTLTGTPGSGTEGESFGLGGVHASAAAGDTLSAVVLVNLPADAQVVGTTDSAGNTIAWWNPVSGTWTIDPNHLADFKVRVHDDQAGTVELNLRAVAQDGALTTTASGSISVITLAPESDGATISGSVTGGIEDGGAIPITLTVADNETKYFSESLAGDTLTVTIAPVKGNDGANHLPGTLKTGTLADGTVVTADPAHPGTYTIKLTQAQVDAFATGTHKFTLSGLEFVPDANYSGSVGISFTAQVQDGTDVTSSTGTVSFTVSPQVDGTTYTVGTLSGKEDQPIPLDLAINHQDLAGTGTWGSETVSVVISGVPAGARIEGATNNGPTTVNGVTTYSWTVDRSSAHMVMTEQGITLKGVNYVSPTDDSSDVQLTVTTYVFEKGVATPVSTSTTITVGVDGVTDGATLNPNNASGLEDQLVAMDLGGQLVDVTGESEVTYITISGVPAGASLRDAGGHAVGTAGAVDAETGARTWTLSTAEVASLDLLKGGKVYFLGAANVSGTWTLTAQAFTRDTDGATSSLVASNALPFTVTVAAVADAPELAVNGAVSVDEDSQVSLGLHAALVDTDSESLTVTITGAPEDSIIRVNTGTQASPVWTDIHGQDGVWTIPAGTAPTLDNVFIKPPADYNGSFTLSVTASSTEQTGGSATTAPETVKVTVNAVNDAPTVHLVSGGVGIEAGTHNAAIKLLGGGDSVTFDDVDFRDAGATALLSKMTVSISGGSGLSAHDALGLVGVPVTLAADGTLVTHPDADTTVAIAYDPATHTLTFRGNATPDQYAALAKHVVISSTSGSLTAGTREVTIAAYDLGGAHSVVTPTGGVTVTVNGAATLTGAALGDVAFSASGAPVLSPGTVATVEDAAPVGLNLAMAAADGVAVTIAGMPAGTVFRDANGAVVDTAHLTAGQLPGLKVDLPDNWNGSATLTVTANANGTVMTETVTLTAAAVNDAPLLSIDHTSHAVVGGATGVVSAPVYVVPHDANVGISDVDGSVIGGMTVQLLPNAGGTYAMGDTLGLYGHDIALNQSCQLVVKGTNILVSYDDQNHTLTFSGDGSYATYADLAKSVVLSNTDASLPTGTRNFSVTMYDDGDAASQTVTTSVNVTNGIGSSVTLSQDAHGTIYWNGSTPVLNGTAGNDTFQVHVGTDWSVNGAGGNDTLMLNCQNGGWTFALNETDHLVHVTSTTDPSHTGVIHLDAGAGVQPFANGSHDIVFNGSASGTIDFGADHTVTFSNLEKIHG